MTTGYVPPVPDYDFVTPRIAVGSRVGENGLSVLQAAGITHIIAVDSHPERELADQHGITIFSHPFRDDLQEKPPSLLLPIAHDALQALESPETKILITCGAGMYRAPMVTLMVLRLLGYKTEEAKNLITSQRWGTAFPFKYVESVEKAVEYWSATENSVGQPQNP